MHSSLRRTVRAVPAQDQSFCCLACFHGDTSGTVKLLAVQAPHAIAAAEAARQEVRRSHAAVRPLLARLGEPSVGT